MNPGVEKGYALDFLSVVRHVATELDRAAPAALSVSDMAVTYRHSVITDLSRVRRHHDLDSDAAAVHFLIERAVDDLAKAGLPRGPRSPQAVSDGNGRYSLAKPFDELLYNGQKLVRVVDSDDEDERRALRAVYNDLTNDRTFYVRVVGSKGGKQERQFRLHPLARSIPQVSEKEFLELAFDVKARGVISPIVVFGGQVLDGRHRLAVAAALKVPIRVDEFKGDDTAARDHVISLNVKRRHLTVAQRALIVQELYLPQAEVEAKKRQGERTDLTQTSGPVGPEVERSSLSSHATEIAATQSNGLASGRTLRRMDPVREAPKTRERVRSGEITTAGKARQEALKEIGRDEKEPTPKVDLRSGYDYLGKALTMVRSACESLEKGDITRDGRTTDEDVVRRINEIRGQLDQAEHLATRTTRSLVP